MRKHPSPIPVAVQVDVLDVRLLDLFAQVEAMLRCARDVQRNAIKLRGTSAPVGPAQQRTIADRIRKSVRTIDRESRTLRTVASSVVQASADLVSAVRSGSQVSQQRVNASRRPAPSAGGATEARAK
jgi:hypothetical protein